MLKTLEEAWNIAIEFLYKSTPAMTAIAILALLSAGILTWYCLDILKLAEANLPLAEAMTQYGSWVVLIFDAEVFVIIAVVYKATKIFAKKYDFWKTFHVFLMMFIMITALLDFGNDLTLALGMNETWRIIFAPAQTNPILKNILWSQRSATDYHSFTSAVYNGTHLEDMVFECNGNTTTNIYPTGNRIYVGANWQDQRKEPMKC